MLFKLLSVVHCLSIVIKLRITFDSQNISLLYFNRLMHTKKLDCFAMKLLFFSESIMYSTPTVIGFRILFGWGNLKGETIFMTSRIQKSNIH